MRSMKVLRLMFFRDNTILFVTMMRNIFRNFPKLLPMKKKKEVNVKIWNYQEDNM